MKTHSSTITLQYTSEMFMRSFLPHSIGPSQHKIEVWAILRSIRSGAAASNIKTIQSEICCHREVMTKSKHFLK